LDEALGLGLPLFGALGWVIEQSGLALSKAFRVISGVALGLGLGWVLALHLQTPWPPEMIRLATGLGLALLLGLAARWVAATSDPRTDLVLPPPETLECTDQRGDQEDTDKAPEIAGPPEGSAEDLSEVPQKGPRHPKMG
jgi:hypothetical protein